jgi:AcrR family transcriptional regulator
LNSAAEEILECGLHGLSISAVAARAEVAERTVYRYFESTETLLDALIQSVGARLGTLLGDQARLRPDRSSSLDELVAHLPALYVALDEIGAPARAVAAVTLARGSDPGRQQRRDLLATAGQAAARDPRDPGRSASREHAQPGRCYPAGSRQTDHARART